jgi:peptidoglycan/xylan/chitin deacetylase (PgdA/CDA1 family)
MTVDVDPPIPPSSGYIIEDGVVAFLKLFDKYAIKATFFVPATVAEKFATIMREIVKQGHEIACHGLQHDPRETTLKLEKELHIIKTATEIIQSATGARPVGFRAPLFKVNKSCWIALQKNDYVYDSSLICFRPYGRHKIFFPSKPFPLFAHKRNENGDLLEVPVSANPLLPYPLGATYLRIFGLKWSKTGVKINFLLQNPLVFHIHPKDVDPWNKGRLWWGPWWGHRNIQNCIKMLEGIIKYAQQSGAKFVTAYELAKLYEVCSKTC